MIFSQWNQTHKGWSILSLTNMSTSNTYIYHHICFASYIKTWKKQKWYSNHVTLKQMKNLCIYWGKPFCHIPAVDSNRCLRHEWTNNVEKQSQTEDMTTRLLVQYVRSRYHVTAWEEYTISRFRRSRTTAWKTAQNVVHIGKRNDGPALKEKR